MTPRSVSSFRAAEEAKASHAPPLITAFEITWWALNRNVDSDNVSVISGRFQRCPRAAQDLSRFLL